MLVPRLCPSPYGVPAGRLAAVGYLSGTDIGLDGSIEFGEGEVYDSPLIDAGGYNMVMWVVAMTGAVPGSNFDVECHYIDPFLATNPAPLFTATMPYGFAPVDGTPTPFTWGTRGNDVYRPAGSTGFRDNSFLHVSFHMSFVTTPILVTPASWLFFAASTEVPVAA